MLAPTNDDLKWDFEGEPPIGLPGAHQRENAHVAVAAALLWLAKNGRRAFLHDRIIGTPPRCFFWFLLLCCSVQPCQ